VEIVHNSPRTRGFREVGTHRIRSRLSGTFSCDTGFGDRTSLLALWLEKRRYGSDQSTHPLQAAPDGYAMSVG
jgi:hypothetical protein